jgi:hypothetical protein
MERIVLEVDSSLASSWRKAPKTLKRKLTPDTELRLKEQIRLAEKGKFSQLLADIRNKAEENGLTEEILKKLLYEGV